MNTVGINETRTKVSGNYRIIIFLQALIKLQRTNQNEPTKNKIHSCEKFLVDLPRRPVLRTLRLKEKLLTKRNNLHCLMSKDKHLQINYLQDFQNL